MLACVETITLIQRKYDATKDKETYICTHVHGVSWYGKLVATVESKGLRGETKVTVRIPEDSMPEVMIQRGDFIVRGTVETISKQADLDGLEYFSVLSVGDNCRSQRKDLRHWAVSGA
jgi:hypothetical protein